MKLVTSRDASAWVGIGVGVAAVLGITGCSPGDLGAKSSTPPVSPVAAVVSDQQKAALATSAKGLKAQVDGLVAPMKGHEKNRKVTMDDAGPCELGSGAGSPQRWGYGLQLTVTEDDTLPAVRTAGSTLRSDGWAVTDDSTATGTLDLTAAKNGATIRIMGGEEPQQISVEGYTSCVASDGTVTSR